MHLMIGHHLIGVYCRLVSIILNKDDGPTNS